MVRETLGQVLQLNHMQKCLCNCCLKNELRFQAKKESFGTLRVSDWSGDVLAPLGVHTLASGICGGARRELRGIPVSPWMPFKVGQEGTLGDEQHLLGLLSTG